MNKYQFISLNEYCLTHLKYLDWESISKVTISQNADIHCPICLEDSASMAIPHITNCGHVLCLPCILQHFELSKNKHKCPICNDLIFLDNLKSVTVHLMPMFKVKDEITLTLRALHKQEKNLVDIETGKLIPEFKKFQ